MIGAVECSSKSSHNMSFSVPSIVFEMPHFLNERATISAGRLFYGSSTHWHMVLSDAALTFPPAVCSFSPSIIHVVHFSWSRSLKDLFRLTSRCCKTLVSPPGVTAMSVLVSLRACLTKSTKCALKESQINKLFFQRRPPGCNFQTF